MGDRGNDVKGRRVSKEGRRDRKRKGNNHKNWMDKDEDDINK